MRKTTLRIDALFLCAAGLFGLVSHLLSYASGAGPFGDTFHQNPLVIGVVEAHALAVVTAGTLWHLSRKPATNPGHWVGLVAHTILGGSNMIWFEVFTRVQAETQGLAVTIVHFAFVAVNAFLIGTRSSDRVGASAGE